ncbi:MAG TPA: hypothetical protein VJW75_04625 [Candidatus Eisenbacteria bacterium]|nr:hypothetical protein [Candidatus Eisenbacteria bacterium]
MAFATANWPCARSRSIASARFRPPATTWYLYFSLLLGSAAFAGCGGANAPCPTPTTELDRHRDESFEAQREVGAVLAEERALRAERESAAARLQAARAALDSLAPSAGTE